MKFAIKRAGVESDVVHGVGVILRIYKPAWNIINIFIKCIHLINLESIFLESNFEINFGVKSLQFHELLIFIFYFLYFNVVYSALNCRDVILASRLFRVKFKKKIDSFEIYIVKKKKKKQTVQYI